MEETLSHGRKVPRAQELGEEALAEPESPLV